ncbi:hypothetical protein AAFF_G00097720 [Aldrovandia affinis]|uniref:Uncharacterized protein n=1 Tax=Aldrovandia affinis TaxID=143900 RepID=A0AAD7RV77_9TELE|nr:hypothetical protein AAFF_G00097720 [Aldrovandia affinis]
MRLFALEPGPRGIQSLNNPISARATAELQAGPGFLIKALVWDFRISANSAAALRRGRYTRKTRLTATRLLLLARDGALRCADSSAPLPWPLTASLGVAAVPRLNPSSRDRLALPNVLPAGAERCDRASGCLTCTYRESRITLPEPMSEQPQ